MHELHGLAKCKPKQVVCSSATESGERICGQRGTLSTCYAPDKDVLNPYQVGCAGCLGVFEATGGKIVWSRV